MDWDLTSIVPSNISADEAASIPIPFMTAVQSLYLRLGLPEPPAKLNGEWILIWSGVRILLIHPPPPPACCYCYSPDSYNLQNTSVGRFAIQLAKLSGLKVATTASKKNWDKLRALGADLVVDYKVRMRSFVSKPEFTLVYLIDTDLYFL